VPRRKQLPVVERDAGRRDIGRPEIDRLLHSVLRGLVTVDRLARVFAAVADHGKPVVLPLLHRVDLVAAARTVLARPQLAGARMNRHALDVAKAERVDLRMRAGAGDKRVVLRHRSVRIDPQDLAHVAVELLRLRPVDGVDTDARRYRRRDEERAIRRLNQPPARSLSVEQRLDVLEPPIVRR
jgi:hypothetical protein